MTLDEMLTAVKGYHIVVRPWLDGAIGRKGTVTYVEWERAVARLDAVIAHLEGLR